MSPKKRGRRVKAALDADGDASMTKAHATDEPASKKERRPASGTKAKATRGKSPVEETYVESSDDFLSESEQLPNYRRPTQLQPPAAAPVGGVNVPMVQTSVTEFFKDRPTGLLGSSSPTGATAQHDVSFDYSSLEEDTKIAKPKLLETLHVWLQQLRAHIVDNVGNGWCLMHAMDAAYRQEVKGKRLLDDDRAIDEAEYFKDLAATYELHYLDQMIADKTVHLPTLHARYYGLHAPATEDANMRAEVEDFVYTTLELHCDEDISVERWGGPEEIMGLVWGLRQLILIFSVRTSGKVEVQMYHIEQASPPSPYDEIFKIRTVGLERVFVIIQTLLNHHVIPLVLVHKGDPCGGHFQTMRFAQHLYYDWNDEDQESEPMHHRYEEALRKLDIYVTVQRPLLPTAVRPISGPIPAEPVDLSGSVFVPSDSATSAGGESSQDEADERLTPLTLAQRSRLYQALNSHQRLRGERVQLWKAAETQNLLVLQTSLDEEGSADDLIAAPNALTAAFGRRAQQPHAAVRLLRRLPYPLVAIAARPTGIITRLGRELAMTGRSARFGEWKAALSEPDAQALADLTAIPASTTTDERWRLAQDKTKWDAMSTLLGRDVSSHRSLPSTTEDQAMKLLVAIVATLPEDKPVADLCDQAHFWLSTNPGQAQVMLRDMRNNDWTSVASACRTISAAVPPDSPESVTATGSFFRPTNNRTYRRQLHSDFRKLENSIAHRKRPKRKPPRSAIQHASLRTQNVRGMPKDAGKPELWFGLFRAKEEGAQPALTLVQETHVVHGEGAEMARRYRATWGFNANAAPMSFWSETDTRTGGVGILLNPYAVPHAAAAHESLWDGNFIAVTCAMEGHQVLVVSIYAPSDDVAKEVFFNKLADYKFQHDGPIVIGGDFNCTAFPALDRSYQAAAAAHSSPGLLRWIHAWQLVDALSESFPHEDADDAELNLFHADHHTYRYSVLEQLATSRLDRWYVSSGATSWASGVTTVDLGGGSDHASVVLQFSDPTGRAHVRRRPKLYPPKACAQSAIDEASTAALTRLHDEYTAMAADGASASAFCHKWETFKSHLAVGMRKVTKTAVRKINMSYRTKIARIRRRLRAPGITVSAASELERDLSTTAARWQGLKQRRKDAQLTQKQHSQTTEFFARAAAPRTRTTIARLDATEGRTRAPADIANRMADGWREVFTQPPRDEVSTRFEHHLVPVLRENEAAGLALPFGTEELRRSLRRCKRTKSGGPDQLPNAWYRAHLDLLVPILQLLYNVCLTAGITPASFQTATIVCLQKAGRTTNPLGYRPISLLNTDYKVYMRLLTTRLKPLLPTMISGSQGGFVPGRAIHDVIDCYAAAQHYATTRNTATIALDIKKAYDSLDRRFMDECLSQRGFPSEFRSAVTAAHTNTTARFEVNGSLSEPLSMTRGIRQGCPLAPMLFIVAMDTLYRRVTHEPVLHEPLPDDPGILPPVAGYADDTALYLRDESCIASAMSVLDDFARTSGLQINKEKSVVIRLNPKAPPVAATHGLPGLPDGQMCRYLGAQIGRGITNQHIWKLVVQQIERRLAMAQVKTHSPAQRAVLAQYVIVSKVLFMARHHWPELPVVNELDQRIRNFVWSGLFAVSSNPSTRTHRWMDMDLARLPHGTGGLGVPNLMTELHTMAAHVVASWAYNPAGAHSKIHELRGHSISPVQPKLYTSTPPMAPALQGSLWCDGRAGLEWCYGYQIKNPTRMLISDSITALRTLPRTWYRGVATRDYRAYYALAGKVILRDREKSEGRLNVLWLPHLEIRPDGSAMIHPDGGTLTQYHVKSLGHGTQLSDFVSWQWRSHGRVDFTPPCFPLSNSQADAFILLCDILVANFPGILHRPDDEGQVRPTNVAIPGDLEWFVPGDGFVHMRDHGFTVRTTQITSQHDLQRQSPVHVDGKLTTPIFECGPSLTALAQPWTGQHPWRPQRRVLKRRLNAGSVRRGRAARGKRATKWREDDEDMYVAITNVPWHKFMTAGGLSTYEHQLWHRLRLHQLELWPKSTDCASCSTTEWTGSVGTGPAHIAWHCADAQTLWRDLAAAWGADGLSAGDLQLAVFSRRAPPTAIDWRAAFPERGSATVGDRLQHWISILWRQLVTCGLRRLWYNQVQRIYDPDRATLGNSFAARAAWARAVRGSITAAARSSDDHKELDQRVLRTLYQRLVTHTMEIPKFAGTTTTYVLFFDGGSRGNPGPGGSGSVIVQLYPEPQIVWAASMSYAAKSTTNNHAEYRGLCTGLTAAATNAWHPLTVVGDSMMIIRQMQHRRPPRTATLLPWYEQARANADHIQVLG